MCQIFPMPSFKRSLRLLLNEVYPNYLKVITLPKLKKKKSEMHIKNYFVHWYFFFLNKGHLSIFAEIFSIASEIVLKKKRKKNHFLCSISCPLLTHGVFHFIIFWSRERMYSQSYLTIMFGRSTFSRYTYTLWDSWPWLWTSTFY